VNVSFSEAIPLMTGAVPRSLLKSTADGSSL
jgi:hypothetical protein